MSKPLEGMMQRGDKVTVGGQSYTCTWTSDEMTDEDRYQSHMRTADFIEQYGLSGAFQRAMAEKYRQGGSERTANA